MQGVFNYTHGISAVDSHLLRPMQSAVHLVVEGGRAAIIDTASSRCVPRVLDALEEKGVPAEGVDWIVLTHIHLDHAGGAGEIHAPLSERTAHGACSRQAPHGKSRPAGRGDHCRLWRGGDPPHVRRGVAGTGAAHRHRGGRKFDPARRARTEFS